MLAVLTNVVAVPNVLSTPVPLMPSFISRSAIGEVQESEARHCLQQMKRCSLFVGGDVNADVATTYWESDAVPAAKRTPPLTTAAARDHRAHWSTFRVLHARR